MCCSHSRSGAHYSQALRKLRSVDNAGHASACCTASPSSPLPQHYWMLVVFCEHDEARSHICIFPVEQVCTIYGFREWYIYKLLGESCNTCGTFIKELLISCDLGAEVQNKLIGCVDSDFGSDPDTRISMTCYLMYLMNGGPNSWRSSNHLDKKELL